MAKTFAKIAKTFVGLSVTIVAKGRRLVLILHFEEKYAKMDYKNEIYAKNWVRSTCSAKKSTLKKSQRSKSTVNGQQMMSQDDVAMTSVDQWMLTQLGLTWQRG